VKKLMVLFAIIAVIGCSKVILKPEEKGLYDKAVIAIEAAKQEIKDAENTPKTGGQVELFKTAKEKLVTAESFLGISNFEKACSFAEQSRDIAKKAGGTSK